MSPRARHITRVVLISLLLTILASLAAGMTYEWFASNADRRRNPRIGTLFPVNGTKLNLYCSGTGSPVVILESGLGIPGYGWYRVQPEIAKFTRTCWYDRAGYGWSDPYGTPRDSKTIATELHSLLQAANVPPPYLMVGHSFGGMNVRVFNGLYPNEVSGMVLVDSSQEDQVSRMPPAMRAQQERSLFWFRLMPAALKIGLVRVLRSFHDIPFVPPSVTGPARATLDYLMFQPKFFSAIRAEMQVFDSLSAVETRASGKLGSKPLTVLTAGKRDEDEFSKAWVEELQPALARLSTRGKRVMVKDSTHMIPFERPGAVVDAVREMISAK